MIEIEISSVVGTWMRYLTMREDCDRPAFVISRQGIFAKGRNWWAFKPDPDAQSMVQLLRRRKKMYVRGTEATEESAAILATLDGVSEWSAYSRSDLYLFAKDGTMFARDDATSPDELPYGIVIAGHPLDPEDVEWTLAALPSDVIHAARVMVRFEGLPTSMLALRWQSTDGDSYLLMRGAPTRLFGRPTRPMDEWWDYDEEQRSNANDEKEAMLALRAPKKARASKPTKPRLTLVK